MTSHSTRHLTLLRHAQAFTARAGQHDFERPLDATGLEQLRLRAPAFAASVRAIPVDHCRYSPALRTATTAAAFVAALHLPPDATRPDPTLYDIEPQDLLAWLRCTDARVRHLLVVGHNPALSAAAWQLSSHAPRSGLSPCDYVTIAFSGEWLELR